MDTWKRQNKQSPGINPVFAIDCRIEFSGFKLLTTLELHYCCFMTNEDLVEPFSKFPCLENLDLADCSGEHEDEGELVRLRVSGLELVTLSLLRVDVSQLELSAPKLESFGQRFLRLLQFSVLSVPSLVHADIQSHWRDSYNEDLDKEHLVFMFRGLRSVESLTLCRKITQVFSKISKFLEQQPCPFTKLKNLSLEFYSSDDIPHKVLHDYFLNGSSNASLNIQIRDGWC